MPVDVTPLLNRLGMRLVIDTTAATDSAGHALPDLRVGIDGGGDGGGVMLVVTNPASTWARAGLRTGDRLVAFQERAVAGAADFWPALRALRVGDSASLEVKTQWRAPGAARADRRIFAFPSPARGRRTRDRRAANEAGALARGVVRAALATKIS